MGVIINKNHIVIEAKQRSEWRRTPNITMHKFKKRSGNKRCFIQMKPVHLALIQYSQDEQTPSI